MGDNGEQVDDFDANRYSIGQRFHQRFKFREIPVSHPFVSIGAVLALSAAAPAFAAAPATAAPKMTLAQAPAKPAARSATRADLLKSADANFKKVDLNGDGTLNKAEIDAAQVRMQQAASANIGARIQSEFNKLDTDRNGQLSLAEFRAAAPAPKAPGSAAAAAMQTLDVNKDGKISAEEYRAPMLTAFNAVDSNKDGTISAQERAQAQSRRSAQRSN